MMDRGDDLYYYRPTTLTAYVLVVGPYSADLFFGDTPRRIVWVSQSDFQVQLVYNYFVASFREPQYSPLLFQLHPNLKYFLLPLGGTR